MIVDYKRRWVDMIDYYGTASVSEMPAALTEAMNVR